MKNHWINQAVFYHIYPLGFCGAPRFAHDEIDTTSRILKLIDWIDHLKEMSVNALYLGPIFASYEHGYDTSDYRKLDHRLGTNEDFKRVAEKLQEAGIHIVLDGVFNHVGRSFWAFQDVLEHKEASPYKDWFHNINFHNTSPYGDPFSYEAWEGHYNLVKLNLQNEEVVQYLLDSVGYWIDEFAIDGLRLDAADCIDRNFFKRLKVYTQAKKADFWLMGEIIHGNYCVWANPEMLDSVTNYECYKGLYSSHNTKNYFEIAYSLNRQFGKGGMYADLFLYNFVDNHDVNRLAYTISDPANLNNVYTMLYTMPGIPSIYYGSEYGISGYKHDGSDADIRPCLILSELDNDLPLYRHIVRLGELRSTYPALQTGTYEQVIIRNESFVYKRQTETQTIYVAYNIAEEPISLTIPNEIGVVDLLHDQVYHKDESGITISISPHDSAILLVEEMASPLKQKMQETKEDNTEVIHKEAVSSHKEETKEPQIPEEEAVNEPNSQDETNTPLKLGKYRHFKGKDYAVLYLSKHSETLEDYVVYRQLYGDCNVWIRPLSMFLENVEVDGALVPRFTYLGK